MAELSGLSDEQLVVLVGRWTSDALAEVYRRHGRAVYGLSRRVVSDQTEAEDVTQDVFVQLWLHPDRFDSSRGSLRTFLLTKAHGRSVDVIRSRTARVDREHAEARATVLSSQDVEREVWNMVLAEKMTAAMGSLPTEERTAIELAYFEGHTYKEVARLLSQPEGTVKSRIRNGLLRLRKSLTEGGVRNDVS